MNRLRLESHDGGRLLINPAYYDLLAANGLVTFEAVMAYGGGEVLRTLALRENVRLELAGADGRRVVFYAKRHRAPPWTEQVWRLLTGRGARSFGRREWDAAALLAAAGISTAEPVAVGERRRGPLAGESFFIAAGLPGYQPADDLLRQMAPSERTPVLEAIADLARRFHQAGFNHRDFYLCHVFVRRGPAPGPHFDLALIDLQRVERFLWRRRWLVKDVAQLAYSARGILCAAEWEEWLCRYFATERLDRRQRRFAAAVRRKADRIARRTRRRRLKPPINAD